MIFVDKDGFQLQFPKDDPGILGAIIALWIVGVNQTSSYTLWFDFKVPFFDISFNHKVKSISNGQALP